MKWRAEADLKLPHAAARLIARLISAHIVRPGEIADAEFPLTWKDVQKLVGVGEDQAYRLLESLAARGYLWKVGVRKCPPKTFYKFAFNHKDCEESNSRKNAGNDSRKNAGNNSGTKAGSHISNPFGKNNGIKGAAVAAGIESTKAHNPALRDHQLKAQGRELAKAMREAVDGGIK